MDADRETVEEQVNQIAEVNGLRDETIELAIDAVDAAGEEPIAEEPFTTAGAALYAAALITNDTISVRTIGDDAGIQPGVIRERSLELIDDLD